MNKRNLRQISREKRRALSPLEQFRAGLAILKQFASHPIFRRAKNIAFYLPNDGEISPLALMRCAKQIGKHCFLPTLNRKNALTFRHFKKLSDLKRNRFGILEPRPRCQQKANTDLDLVFMPLVAFDLQGNRIGMGGGYYDRSFAYKNRNQGLPPLLIGLAHHCQKATDELESDNWDVPMDYIVTDKEIITPRRKRKR